MNSKTTPKKIKIKITGFRRKTYILAHAIAKPPLEEVRKQIRIEMETCAFSHTEADGVIRDEEAIFEIACLQKALQLLPRRA
jgi:hypothetical protein